MLLVDFLASQQAKATGLTPDKFMQPRVCKVDRLGVECCRVEDMASNAGVMVRLLVLICRQLETTITAVAGFLAFPAVASFLGSKPRSCARMLQLRGPLVP